ncbi:AMP-binding protein [Streptomyces atratus]|uniref:AMP-binding protein n=1 Tax=Streptomyces atratus TaxID=1893 RepID=UPI003789EE04
MADWNGPAVALRGQNLVERIAAQAACTPDEPSVVADDVQLTYQELNERANRLARLLIARGAGPETPVAAVLPRSAALVVTFLAILRVGACHLPVDPTLPADRISLILVVTRSTVALPACAAPASSSTCCPPQRHRCGRARRARATLTTSPRTDGPSQEPWSHPMPSGSRPSSAPTDGTSYRLNRCREDSAWQGGPSAQFGRLDGAGETAGTASAKHLDGIGEARVIV